MNTYKLYEGKYTLTMAPESHRYNVNGEIKRGVTGILSSTLSKEGLMLWPMDEALRLLFGQEFKELLDDDGNISVTPTYNAHKASLKPGQTITAQLCQLLLESARGAHTQKRDKGADTGKRAHHYFEQFLTTGVDKQELAGEAKEVQTIIAAFLSWYENQDFETVLAERPVYSELHEYCGTPDQIFTSQGKLIVNDYKTTNYSRTAPLGIYPENFAQVGAYAQAYKEEFGVLADDLMITNISKQGKINVVKASDLGLSVQDCVDFWFDILSASQKLGQVKKALTGFNKLKKEAV